MSSPLEVSSLAKTTPLLIPESGNLERQLRSFVFFSHNHRGDLQLSEPLDFLSVVWKGEVKFPDESDQYCVHLDDAICRKVVD